MNKARNLIEHEKEIFSRPPRVWIQSKRDTKRKAGNYFVLFLIRCIPAESSSTSSASLWWSSLLLNYKSLLLWSSSSAFFRLAENANEHAKKKSKNGNSKGKKTGNENVIIYNYSPKGGWIVVDIYRDAKRRGIYPPLFTDPEVFSIYQIRWIKNAASLMATISSSETFAKRRAIFLSVRKTVNSQGYSELREPIKTRENCYPLIW